MLGNFIVAPFKPFFASAKIYPFLIFIFAPNFFKANKCKSTGLVPIAQPPGRETFAFPYLVTMDLELKLLLSLFLQVCMVLMY